MVTRDIKKALSRELESLREQKQEIDRQIAAIQVLLSSAGDSGNIDEPKKEDGDN